MLKGATEKEANPTGIIVVSYRKVCWLVLWFPHTLSRAWCVEGSRDHLGGMNAWLKASEILVHCTLGSLDPLSTQLPRDSSS